jgi:hypothetical protein
MCLTIGIRPYSGLTRERDRTGLRERLRGQAEDPAAGIHADFDLVASHFDACHGIVSKYRQRQVNGVLCGPNGWQACGDR